MHFIQRWTFCFLRCLLDASTALVNRTRRIGPKTFVRLFREIDADSGGSASCDTQPDLSHTFHKSYCTFVFTLLFGVRWVVPQPSSAETSTDSPNLHPDFRLIEN